MNEKFIEFMKNSGLSENTYKTYANNVEIFKKYYLDSYGENLTTLIHADILMYVNFLIKHNISAKTINKKIAALKQYYLFLVKNNIQNDIVILDKDYIKIQPTILNKKIPSLQEINKLKHFASRDEKYSKRDYCFILIFIYGGLRESEIVSLRLVDIKLEDRFINIVGKGNKFRQVVINTAMYDAISEYLGEGENIKTDNPYLFIGQKTISTQKPLHRSFCNRLLDKYKELCNIPSLHPHALRAYFYTNALHNTGYTIEQIANQAGHSSLNTTKRLFSYRYRRFS